MTEQGGQIELKSVVERKFRGILGGMRSPDAVELNEMYQQGLVRVLTADEAVDAISLRKRGDIGFSIRFNPERTAQCAVFLNTESFVSKGDFRLRDSIDSMLKKFRITRQAAEKIGMTWTKLEDHDVDEFLLELKSRKGERHTSFDLDEYKV